MGRSQESMAKRARERRREQRQEEKQRRREALAAETTALEPEDSARLMEEFRVLSERHDAGQVNEMKFATERQRILAELGIEDE